MDHIGIVKRSWEITWKYRALWVLGFFAGAGGGGGGGRGNYNFGNSSGSSTSGQNPFGSFGNNPEAFFQQIRPFLPVIIAATTVLVLIGIVFWVLAIAARGGLVWLANEAAEGRPVKAGNGWGAGFHFWGRTFLISFLLGLPILAIVLIMAVLFAGSIAAIVSGAAKGSAAGAAAGAGIAGICGIVGVSLIVLVPLAILIGILAELAIRHGVLQDVTAGKAIGAAWNDLRTRFKDVAVLWILLLAIGIAYGIAIGIVGAIFAIPIAGAAVVNAWPVVGVMSFLLFLVLIVPSAIYGAFHSTAWTIFFRRMTGVELVAPPQPATVGYGAPGYMPPPPAPGAYPPPPPMPPAPQAPPMPQQPAPPAAPAPEPPAPEPPAGPVEPPAPPQ